jgi:hypothetical protein
MAKDGKDLQRLIRIIESARAAGKEIAIESPKFFPDRITGRQREHDVVLTIKHAHHEIVVALECRDRSRKVGVSEVEAFQAKCRDTGIHSGIIVSSKGFHSTAKIKAQAYGIRCLTLDQVKGFDWFLPDNMQIISKHITNVHIQIDFERQYTLKLEDIFDREGHPMTTAAINQLAQNALTQHHNLLPKDIGAHTVLFNVQPDLYAIVDGEKNTTVKIVLTVTFENRRTFAPFQFRTYLDQDTGRPIMQAAVASMQIEGRTMDFIASTEEDGTISFAFVPAEKAAKNSL